MAYSDKRYLIGDLLIDPNTREVSRDGRQLDVPKLSFRFLEVLAEAAPGFVTIDQLIERVWQGAVVSPETVTQRVKLLRQALEDDAHDPSLIGVVRGEGYRLIAPVTPLKVKPASTGVHSIFRTKIRLMTVVAFVAVGLILFIRMTDESVPEIRPADRPVSIAVLAFDDMSEGGDQAYLAAGFAEELLNRLSTIDELRVIARTTAFSFRDQQLTIADIANKLEVDAIVHGSIRIAGDKLRIAVQLIDATTEENRWTQTYDRQLDDIFEIQDDIAANVVAQLRVSLLDKRTPDIDTLAYTLYLRGRQLNQASGFLDSSLHGTGHPVGVQDRAPDRLYKRAFRMNTAEHAKLAIPMLQRAIQIEPMFVDAIGELARSNLLSYYFSGISREQRQVHLSRAFELVGRAVAIAPEDPSVVALQGWMEFHHLGNTERGLALFDRALQLDPDNDYVIRLAARSYPFRGLNEEAIHLWQDLLERDPLCVVCQASYVAAHVGADRLEEVETNLKTLLLISEGNRQVEAQNLMGALHLLKGEPAKALRIFENPDILESHRSLGHALALHDLGRMEEFEKTFAELRTTWSSTESGWIEGIVTILGWTGQTDEAFEWLMRDVNAHDHSAERYGGMWGPYFRKLNSDPRWNVAEQRLTELQALPDSIR